MKHISFLTLICSLSLAAVAATSPPPASARKPPAGPRPSADGSRFLFIADTSASMKSIAEAERQALFDLVHSGLDGYMRTGDTLGIWTFNDEVSIGQFPMQVWESDKPIEVATRLTKFLRLQEYEGNNQFEEVMLKLATVVRTVTNVNIIIISDGDTRLAGTPVDDVVNTAYSTRAKERKAAKKPFITTLIAHGGKITRGSVTLPGELIQLPERPAPKVAAKPAAPVSTNAPSSRATAAPAAPKPRADAAPAETSPVSANSRAAAEPPDAPAPAAVPDVIATPAAETASASSTKDAATQSVSNETVAATPPASAPKTFKIVTHLAPRNTNAHPDAVSAPASGNSTGTAVLAQALSPTTVSNSPPAPSQAPTIAASSPAGEQPTASVAIASAPLPSVPVETKSSVSLAREPVVVAARELAGAAIPTSRPQQNAVTAMQVPVQPGLGAIPTLVIGGILLAMALFLLGIALRRMRPVTQGSLITQSMHRR